MDYPLPRWIAHRGGGGLAPENTLAGIRLAARMGFRAVEFDVMLTADGVPVLIHDETLDRTTSGSGRVAQTTWHNLSVLDAGGKFHKAWRGESVPRLQEALDLCVRLGLAANVEIKPTAGYEAETAGLVAETVQAVWPSALPVVLSSFSEAALLVVRQMVPTLPRALLLESIPVDWSRRLEQVDAFALHVSAADLSSKLAMDIVRAGVPLAAYTVNDENLAASCWQAGCRALFTDRLDLFSAS